MKLKKNHLKKINVEEKNMSQPELALLTCHARQETWIKKLFFKKITKKKGSS